jgi:hypothetical protein
MKKIALAILVILVSMFAGCAKQQDFTKYQGTKIELKNNLYLSYEWVVRSATKGDLTISEAGYLTDSKILWINVKKGKELWCIPTDPETGQILDPEIFVNHYKAEGITTLYNAKRFFVSNRNNIQSMLNSLYECPQLKEIGISKPWGERN